METPERPLIVAIDGPSGSGKSSVARGVAQALHFDYLDTGAMYRALTWYMLRNGVDVEDAEAVSRRALEPVVEISSEPGGERITVDGVDVGEPIRGPEVTAAVSAVSAVPAVRERLVALQRSVGEAALRAGRGLVAEGRDMGSVVFPDADLKVFLTADAAVRAARRAAQNIELGLGGQDRAATEADLLRRDELDSSRAESPLVRAPGAVEVDATHLTLEETIATVVRLALEAARS